MIKIAILDFAAALAGMALASTVVWARRRSLAHWIFSSGMIVLAVESLFLGLASCASVPEEMIYWEKWRMAAMSALPGIWLSFSMAYARGSYAEFLKKWRYPLLASVLLPVVFVALLRGQLMLPFLEGDIGHPGTFRMAMAGFLLNLLVLVVSVLVLMNLERTYSAATGTMRWRIKFMVLGLAVIFTVRAYSSSQAVLFHETELSLQAVNAVALLLGGALILRSLLREGHFEVDVYPSRSLLSSSITVVTAGLYLFVVGVLSKIVAFFGSDASFTLKAFIILIALVLLTLVLLSDRVRLRTRRFISQHFQRPFYDYRMVWQKFTQGTARQMDPKDLSVEIVKIVSEIFQALSVTVWLIEEGQGKLGLAASTSLTGPRASELELDADETAQTMAILAAHPAPIDLDASADKWAVTLRRLQPDDFGKGGNRVCVPLVAGGELLGVMMLGDRVSGERFSLQDLDLLKSIGDQVAANLLNIKLSQRLSQAKQLEAFQAMSAFFVHDLKNTASTLSLMLQNLPIHFNDPQFREDALRGISKTVSHINDLIRRLSLLREEISIQPIETDLNTMVNEALKCLQASPAVELVKEFRPLPKVRLDPAHIQNVVVNLALNARDAINARGQIRVETAQLNGWVILSVSDSGCGMAPEFIQRSLFRPFQTTKKQGIGIGMFQCKMIVEAHHGKIEVQSELNKGTTFRILLPAPA
ncbi:MAG TPA: XrtA/PEP-CTERM system histidine kinase PrsK [Verrucomicrobiae bacterium]|jgi:putative PEP-CTERM system histidine kinase|nr:XrtA/PEP-CTERM system histidine kinase PrsK [Verrucomicrobiae bacterium]